MTISAALIVRDEATMIGGCLESLIGHVDEIVIVDTGSVDATQEIAVSHGARLLHHEWTGNFAAARNVALDAVTGDWVLYVDADERLVPAAESTLREIVSAPGHAAFRMKFWPRLGYSPHYELRLFRSDPRIRFEMRIHERVLPSVLEVCKSDNLSIGQTETGIQHLGYEGDQSHKHVRNLPLLVRAVDDDPDRVYYWWHLGETLAALGNIEEAEAALQKGLETARRTGTVRARLETILVVHALAYLYLVSGQATRAVDVLEDGLASRPGDPALSFLMARSLVDLGSFSKALTVLSDLPLEDPEGFCDPDVAYDLRLFGEWAYDLIGIAQFRLQHFSEARDAFLAAAASTADSIQYRAKAAVAANRAEGHRAKAEAQTISFDITADRKAPRSPEIGNT